MMTDESAGSGLHIDGDWKEEAAREKQRLAAAEKKSKAKGKDQKSDPAFIELLNLLGMHAAIALGGAQGPGGEPIPPNPESAKFHIDMLEVLRNKTEGNLTDEEKKTLTTVLYELQQQYVRTMTAAVPPPTGARPPM
jgi:hypothetical protein